MVETGTVEKVSGDKKTVFISVAGKGCTGCAASCVGCGKRRVIKARAKNPLAPGDKAAVMTSDGTAYLLMLLALLVPVAILMIAYFVLEAITSLSPGTLGLISLGASVLYLLVFGAISKARGSFLPEAYKSEDSVVITDGDD